MKTYTELLKSAEWKRRRNEIIGRDYGVCQYCGRCTQGCESCAHHSYEMLPAEVHHKYYLRGRKPWEYPDEALETLCRECHEQRTALNDVLKVAIGLLNERNQEKLLREAKMLIWKQRNEDPDFQFAIDDIPGELCFFLTKGVERDLALLMLD